MTSPRVSQRTPCGAPAWLLLLLYCLILCLTSSTIVAVQPLREMLLHHIGAGSVAANGDEEEQHVIVSDIINCGWSLTILGALPIGCISDIAGPKITALLGQCFLGVGYYLFFFATAQSSLVRLYLGSACIGLAYPANFNSLTSISLLFPSNVSTVLGALSACSSVSWFIPLLLAHLSDRRPVRAVIGGYIAVIACVALIEAVLVPGRQFEATPSPHTVIKGSTAKSIGDCEPRGLASGRRETRRLESDICLTEKKQLRKQLQSSGGDLPLSTNSSRLQRERWMSRGAGEKHSSHLSREYALTSCSGVVPSMGRMVTTSTLHQPLTHAASAGAVPASGVQPGFGSRFSGMFGVGAFTYMNESGLSIGANGELLTASHQYLVAAESPAQRGNLLLHLMGGKKTGDRGVEAALSPSSALSRKAPLVSSPNPNEMRRDQTSNGVAGLGRGSLPCGSEGSHGRRINSSDGEAESGKVTVQIPAYESREDLRGGLSKQRSASTEAPDPESAGTGDYGRSESGENNCGALSKSHNSNIGKAAKPTSEICLSVGTPVAERKQNNVDGRATPSAIRYTEAEDSSSRGTPCSKEVATAAARSRADQQQCCQSERTEAEAGKPSRNQRLFSPSVLPSPEAQEFDVQALSTADFLPEHVLYFDDGGGDEDDQGGNEGVAERNDEADDGANSGGDRAAKAGKSGAPYNREATRARLRSVDAGLKTALGIRSWKRTDRTLHQEPKRSKLLNDWVTGEADDTDVTSHRCKHRHCLCWHRRPAHTKFRATAQPKIANKVRSGTVGAESVSVAVGDESPLSNVSVAHQGESQESAVYRAVYGYHRELAGSTRSSLVEEETLNSSKRSTREVAGVSRIGEGAVRHKSDGSQKDSAAAAALQGYPSAAFQDLPLWSQLKTPHFWVFSVLFITAVFRRLHYSQTVPDFLADIYMQEHPDVERKVAESNVEKYVDLFNVVLPFAFVPCCLWGMAVTRWGVLPVLWSLSCIGVLTTGVAVVPRMALQPLGIALNVVYTSYVFGLLFSFVSTFYGFKHFGTLQGIQMTLAGLTTLLGWPIWERVMTSMNHSTHRSYITGNLLLTIWGTLTLLGPLFLQLWPPKRSKALVITLPIAAPPPICLTTSRSAASGEDSAVAAAAATATAVNIPNRSAQVSQMQWSNCQKDQTDQTVVVTVATTVDAK